VDSLSDVPELPEVESVRRQLAPRLTGRRVEHVWWDRHPSARFHAVLRLQGQTIGSVDRRGKFLVLPLRSASDPERLELILHLGMTGSLRFAPTSSVSEDRSADGLSHVRARLALDDGASLVFRDPRRFGRLSVVPAGRYAEIVPTLATIGPEPLSPAFTVTDFATALARTRAPIKAKLLPATGRRHRQHLRRRGAVAGADPPRHPPRRPWQGGTAPCRHRGGTDRGDRPGRHHLP